MIPQEQADTFDTRTPDKGRLTEAEVRVAGHTSQRLLTLRAMLARASSGGTVQTTAGTLQIAGYDMEAVLALLIERDEAMLTGFNIQLDREGSI